MKLTALYFSIVLAFTTGTSFGETFVVGVENVDYMPYYRGISDDYNGFARDLLDAFAEKNDFVFTYKPLPVIRLFKSLLNYEIDFKFPDNPQWQREMKEGFPVVYSNVVVSTVDGVMVLPKNKGKGLHSLKRLGTVMGFTPWQYNDLISSGAVKLYENPNFDGLLKQIITGRLDGAFVNPVVVAFRLESDLKMTGALVFDNTLPNVKNNYCLSTLKHSSTIERFNLFLEKEKQLITKLKQHYGISDY